jgi:class 3 adenylate cyclase
MSRPDRIRTTYSEGRLEALIEKRLAPGADKAAVDARIWDLFGERWAVMFTDLAGFSRNVAEFGIIHFLQVIHESHRLLVPVIEDQDGILLKIEGDSMLVIFRSPAKAISCGLHMQRTLAAYNARKRPSEKVLLCVGIGHGDVLRIGDHDVFGAEVNAAAKLGEDTAKSGEILVTGAVRDAAHGAAGLRVHRLGSAPAGTESAWRVEAVARRAATASRPRAHGRRADRTAARASR